MFGLWAASGPLLTGFASLMHSDDPSPSDAMVVLLGAPGHRCPKAAELYRGGMAPLVLVTSSSEIGGIQTDLYRRNLVRMGVPNEVIGIIPGTVRSTRDEALRTRDFLRSAPEIRRVIVVTCGFHSGRAGWIFRRELRGTDVDVRVAAAPDASIDETNWYRSRAGRRLYAQEFLKTVYYRVAYSL